MREGEGQQGGREPIREANEGRGGQQGVNEGGANEGGRRPTRVGVVGQIVCCWPVGDTQLLSWD